MLILVPLLAVPPLKTDQEHEQENEVRNKRQALTGIWARILENICTIWLENCRLICDESFDLAALGIHTAHPLMNCTDEL